MASACIVASVFRPSLAVLLLLLVVVWCSSVIDIGGSSFLLPSSTPCRRRRKNVIPIQPYCRVASIHRISSSSSPDDFVVPAPLFTDAVFDKIAARVQEQVRIPMVPSPIVTYCLTRALQRMSQDLSPALIGQVEDVLAAEATASKNDDLTLNELNTLSDQIARELVDKGVVDVPMLESTQEYEVMQQIFRVVFSILTTSDDERRQAFVASTQLVAQDLLSDTPERRKALVAKLNAAVDIPILGEDQEEIVLAKAVDMCANVLQTLLPSKLAQSIRGESEDSLAELKEFLITKVNEKVDLIGLSEEQEGSMIRTMIDLLIESYVDPTATDLLSLNKQDQRVALERQLVAFRREISLSRARFDREQASLASQLEQTKTRLGAL